MSIRIQVLFFVCLFLFPFLSPALAGPGMSEKLKAEFSQYPESSVIQTMASEGHEQVVLDCGPADWEKVFAYYREKAVKNGWTVSTEVKSADTCQLMLTKNNQNAMIVVIKEEESTSVVLSLFR